VTENHSSSEPLADAIVRVLQADGVDRVFGVPSGYFSRLPAALSPGSVPSVEGRHEGSTAMMAAAYAQATGQPAVLYTASGPGTTNALTGLAAAYSNFVPMVLLASGKPITPSLAARFGPAG
jgi:acetolactate synthase-1/2/3 large subunit